MITYFVVQGFTEGRKGAIVADSPRQARNAEHAQYLAEKLSQNRLGVVAFSRTGDPSTGDFDDALVLSSYGVIPDEAQQLRVA